MNAFFGKNPNHNKRDSNHDDDSGNEYDDYQGHLDNKDDADDDNDMKKNNNKSDKENDEEKDEPEDEESTGVKRSEPDEEKKDENESDAEEEKRKCELAHYFFSFLNKPELNITLVGYFGKVLNHLLLKRQSDVNNSYLEINNNENESNRLLSSYMRILNIFTC